MEVDIIQLLEDVEDVLRNQAFIKESMQKVIRYECGKCGKLFQTEEHCFDHEEKHKRIDKANKMLKDGCILRAAVVIP